MEVITPGDPNYVDPPKIQVILSSPAPNIPSPATIPPKPRGVVAISRYFDANKEWILADVAALGEKETKKKWSIKSSSTWVNLKKKWGLPLLVPHRGKAAKPANIIAEKLQDEAGAKPADGLADKIIPLNPYLGEKIYVVSEIGLKLINRLIDFWEGQKQTGTTKNSASWNLAIDQTIEVFVESGVLRRIDYPPIDPPTLGQRIHLLADRP